MNTKPFLAFASILSMACSCFCEGQTNVVLYGANSDELPLVFADSSLSATVQAAITADLRLCLQEWGRKSELRLRTKGQSAGYLFNPIACPHYPAEIEFPKNIVLTPTVGLALEIPTPLSDAYTNAFAFAAANTNIVAAAYEFVAFISSDDFAAIPAEDLPDYFMAKNTAPSEVVAKAQQIISDLRHQTYHPPSILGFRHSEVGPSATNLWLLIPCSSPGAPGHVEWSPFPALRHDGKWRFCVWRE